MSKEYGFGRSLTARGSLRPGLMSFSRPAMSSNRASSFQRLFRGRSLSCRKESCPELTKSSAPLKLSSTILTGENLAACCLSHERQWRRHLLFLLSGWCSRRWQGKGYHFAGSIRCHFSLRWAWSPHRSMGESDLCSFLRLQCL